MSELVDKPRAVHMAHASAHLTVARDALERAAVSLHCAVQGQDDPAWALAAQLRDLHAQTDRAWEQASDMVWTSDD